MSDERPADQEAAAPAKKNPVQRVKEWSATKDWPAIGRAVLDFLCEVFIVGLFISAFFHQINDDYARAACDFALAVMLVLQQAVGEIRKLKREVSIAARIGSLQLGLLKSIAGIADKHEKQKTEAPAKPEEKS